MAVVPDFGDLVREEIAYLKKRVEPGSMLNALAKRFLHEDPAFVGDLPVQIWESGAVTTFAMTNGDRFRLYGQDADDNESWTLEREGRTGRCRPARVKMWCISWFNEEGEVHNLFGPAYWHHLFGFSYYINGRAYAEEAFKVESIRILTENPSLEVETGRLTKGARA